MNQTISAEPIDIAIGQVETLYRSLTGRPAPPLDEKSRSSIPPEKSPEQHVQEQMDRLLDSLARFSHQQVGPRWVPLCSVAESEREVRISLDIPGVKRDAIKIRMIGQGWLEVSGERVLGVAEGEDVLQLRYAEPTQGEFRRLIPLPPEASADGIRSELRDGVLEIRVPRDEASQGRSVPVD